MPCVTLRPGMPMYDASLSAGPYLALRAVELAVDGSPFLEIEDLDLSNTGITIVMGPNGAGKSLLLRLLHGLIQPTRGRIFCWGQPLSQAGRRSQSLVFQSPVLLRRTTEANVRFVLKARGLDANTAKEHLARVGLEDKSRTPARRLSGGEKQRLAIAQALATGPRTLLLDEPTASLDPRSTRIIEDILRDVTSKGTRVLMVTHDALQAKRLADEVVFLADGRIVEHAPAQRFFDRPSTKKACAYLEGRLNT